MSFPDKFRGVVLGAIDHVNIWLDPFKVRDADVDKHENELELKARIAWADIKKNWLHGPEKEFYWHMDRNDLGDMCIWHGFYTATCAFMGDVNATDSALLGMEKLLYLGGDSRLCRGADAINGQHASDPSRKYYTEGYYIFTDECSESSMIGFLFGLWAVRKCFAPGSPRVKRANRMAIDIAAQLNLDGMRMLNRDDTPAKFGDLRPGLFSAPIRISAGACAMLMGETGLGIPSDYALSYKKISENHIGALTHPETHFLFVHPWYQDLIAYAVLVMQADLAPESLRPKFRRAMGMMWRKTYKEDSPLYCAMAAEAGARPQYEDILRCARTLNECNVTSTDFPSPKLPGSMTNPDPSAFNWGFWKWKKRVSRMAIPAWRRPPADFLWQRCPYTLDGASADTFNWMDYCLAWSLGRRNRLW